MSFICVRQFNFVFPPRRRLITGVTRTHRCRESALPRIEVEVVVIDGVGGVGEAGLDRVGALRGGAGEGQAPLGRRALQEQGGRVEAAVRGAAPAREVAEARAAHQPAAQPAPAPAAGKRLVQAQARRPRRRAVDGGERHRGGGVVGSTRRLHVIVAVITDDDGGRRVDDFGEGWSLDFGEWNPGGQRPLWLFGIDTGVLAVHSHGFSLVQ